MNKFRCIVTLCCIAMHLLTINCVAETYKWVDENGVMHFTDNPLNIPANPQSPSQTIPPEKSTSSNQLKTSFSILTLRQLLINKDFSRLNTTLADYQKSYESDVKNEDNLFEAYVYAFDVNDLKYETLFNEWVKKYSDIYQPYLARAAYFVNLGWNTRGFNWISNTSGKQIEGMESYFAKALQDIEQVLKIKSDHIVSYCLMINIYGASGRNDELKEIVKKALEKIPYSFRIRKSYLLSLTPSWGGSYEEMDKFATQFQNNALKNPRIKALKGFNFFDMGKMQKLSGNYEDAIDLLNKALSVDDMEMFYAERGDIYYEAEKYDEALKDINRAIEKSYQNADYYLLRSKILGEKKMFQESLIDIKYANQLKPNNKYIKTQHKIIFNKIADSKNPPQKKIISPASIRIEGYDAEIQANPDYSYAYQRRATAFFNKEDYESAYRDSKKAIELDPADFDSYLTIDAILSKKSDWDSIINYWSRYIDINPYYDNAYLLRGAAYFKKGEIQSAVDDAKSALDLRGYGVKEAQKMYDKYKSYMKK